MLLYLDIMLTPNSGLASVYVVGKCVTVNKPRGANASLNPEIYSSNVFKNMDISMSCLYSFYLLSRSRCPFSTAVSPVTWHLTVPFVCRDATPTY